MKQFILLVMLLLGTAAGFAQTKPAKVDSTKKTVVKQVQNPAAWACPKCFMITKDGGQCSMDQTNKVQLGTYYCEHCIKATGNKPGKCPSCNGATTQMTRKFCAQHNKMPAKKAA